MFHFILILLAVLGTSCGRPGERPASPSYSLSQEFLSAYSTLSQEYRKQQDLHGFIETQECDSILFSSLGAIGINEQIDILSARDENGQWYRRPLSYPECLSSAASNSTISRDMFMGLFWYLWKQKDVGTLRAIYSYGEDNNWEMGQGDPNRTNLRFGLRSTLGAMIAKLEGRTPDSWEISDPFLSVPVGFEAHLQVLHILLRGEVYGSLGVSAISRIKDQVKRQPQNPLFQLAEAKWVSGDYSRVEQLLLQGPWPLDRAATGQDYCTHWPMQRDLGKDWQPCTSDNPEINKLHSAGDWLFVARLLQDSVQ